MKHYYLSTFAAVSLLALSGCATDDDDDDGPRVQSTTTTTEETRVHQPAASTQTQTIRTY